MAVARAIALAVCLAVACTLAVAGAVAWGLGFKACGLGFVGLRVLDLKGSGLAGLRASDVSEFRVSRV